MAAKSKRKDGLDFESAARVLEEHWQAVTTEAAAKPDCRYVDDEAIGEAVHDSINHDLVSYRFCLPIQVLGKIVNPALDCLRLQKSDPSDTTGWDARSFGRKVEGTLHKSRQRQITEILFTAKGSRPEDKQQIEDRISRAFTAGQNLYIFDFFELARSVLALGGESIRITFLKKVGEHLDTWNTQPRHRQAWQKLLQRL